MANTVVAADPAILGAQRYFVFKFFLIFLYLYFSAKEVSTLSYLNFFLIMCLKGFFQSNKLVCKFFF